MSFNKEKIIKDISKCPSRFATEFLNLKEFGSKRFNCPIHHSKDGDLSFFEGKWHCFGKCSCSYNSIRLATLVANSITNDEWISLSKNEKRRMEEPVLANIEKWLAGQNFDKIEEKQDDSNVFVYKDNENEYNNYLKLKPFIIQYRNKWDRNSSLKSCEKHLPICRARWDRYSSNSIWEYSICEFTDKAPNFLRNFYLYEIFDEQGRLVGAQGRRINDIETENDNFKVPKMYNFPGFKKNSVLYGLYQALTREKRKLDSDDFPWTEDRKLPEICLHEGQGDVIKAYEHGYMYSVALMGRELSPTQIDLLRKYVEGKIIVFLDNDIPGIESGFKIAKILFNSGFKEVYITRIKSNEIKDVGASTKELFFESLNSKKKVTLEWLNSSEKIIRQYIKEKEKED